MRRFASIIAACAVVSLAQPVHAVENPPSWEVYDISNSGLPSDMVYEVAVDGLGRVWLGCKGLTMFDGEIWKNADQVTVLQIAIDDANTAWCASDLFGGALTHSDGNSITSYNSENSELPSNWVTGVTVDNNNTVWAACAFTGVGEFDGTTWTRHLSGSEVGGGYLTMTHDRNNTIWMVNGIELLRYRDGEWTPIEVPDLTIADNITDITAMPDGSIWVGTTSLGIGRYDGTSWKFHSTAHKELPSNHILATAVDSSGVLWVGTDEGLSSFNGSTWQTHHKDNWVLPDNNVRAIAVGPDNSLWIGTNKGLLHATQNTTDVPDAAEPAGLALSPNPVDGDVVIIRFSLPVPVQAEVEVYSATGERIAVVAAGSLAAGDHSYSFDSRSLAAGAYYCSVNIAGRSLAHTPFVVRR